MEQSVALLHGLIGEPQETAVLIEVLYGCKPSRWRDRTIGMPDVKICIHWVLTEMNDEVSEIRHLKEIVYIYSIDQVY